MDITSNIVNGNFFADKIIKKVEKCVTILRAQQLIPGLAIILVGENPASAIYVRNKLIKAMQVGIKAIKVELPKEITTNAVREQINKLNMDSTISGIIVQLPLPDHIDKNTILSAIDPAKDVDGFHPLNVGYLHGDSGDGFVPCTALGCLELIKQLEPNLAGRNAVIIGRSNIVGKPLSALLLKENCTVTICHSKTQSLPSITSRADIVVAAIGSPGFLTADYFNSKAIVIDVGITRINDRIVGDVDFKNVHDKVKYITPVPGGVGPLTIAFLLLNTLKAIQQQYQLNDIYE